MPSQNVKGSDPESSKCRFDCTAADADPAAAPPARTVAAVAPTNLDRVLMTTSQAAGKPASARCRVGRLPLVSLHARLACQHPPDGASCRLPEAPRLAVPC